MCEEATVKQTSFLTTLVLRSVRSLIINFTAVKPIAEYALIRVLCSFVHALDNNL